MWSLGYTHTLSLNTELEVHVPTPGLRDPWDCVRPEPADKWGGGVCVEAKLVLARHWKHRCKKRRWGKVFAMPLDPIPKNVPQTEQL